jgi:hypothetical protein
VLVGGQDEASKTLRSVLALDTAAPPADSASATPGRWVPLPDMGVPPPAPPPVPLPHVADQALGLVRTVS